MPQEISLQTVTHAVRYYRLGLIAVAVLCTAAFSPQFSRVADLHKITEKPESLENVPTLAEASIG